MKNWLSHKGLESTSGSGLGAGFLPQVEHDYRDSTLTIPYRNAAQFTKVYHP